MSLQTPLRCIPLLMFCIAAASAGDLKNTPFTERSVVAVGMLASRTPWVSGTWRTWQNNRHKPDVTNAYGHRDISSVFYPAVGLYDCSDPDYIEYACQTMVMCHIDAITFYTPKASDEWHMDALKKWVAVMQRYGLRGMPRPQPESSVADLDALLSVFAPVALTWNGRTVYPFFNINADRLKDLAQWKAAKSPEPLLIKWIVQTCKPPFDGGFDWAGNAMHPERETAKREGWKMYFDARLAREGYDADVARAEKLIAAGMSFYAEGVNPGFDDSAVNGWGKGNHYIERADGETYRYRWKRAVENGYPMVFIPTWDDWGEGSMIEATVEFGNRYLEITREFASQYRGIASNTANLSVPQWIYLVRKSSADASVREVMDRGSLCIEKKQYTEAESLVMPLAVRFDVTNIRYR